MNVRVLCDAEEEVGGASAAAWVGQDERGADAAVVFDTAMLDDRLPAFYLGTRGTAYFHLTVRPDVATSTPASTAESASTRCTL